MTEGRRYGRFVFPGNTSSNSKNVAKIKFLVVDRLFGFINMTSLVVLGTLSRRLVAYLNFTLDKKNFLCWYKPKRGLVWAMTAAKVAENHGAEWDSTWYLGWEMFQFINSPTHKFESSKRSIQIKDTLPWYISSIITKTIPINRRIIKSNAMKRSNPFRVEQKVKENQGNNNETMKGRLLQNKY